MKHLKCIEKFVQGKVVFCGIDIHARHWNLCYICDGEVIEKLIIPGDCKSLKMHTESYYIGAASVHFVYEAGFSGFWIYHELTACGYKCTITPPSRVPVMDNKVKTDKRDAEKLARFLAGGLLRNVYVPPPSVEKDRQLLRLYRGYKKKMTRVKNQINSFLRLYGLSWEKTEGCRWTKRHVAWLKDLSLDGETSRFVLEQYLEEYRFLRLQITFLKKRIRQLSRSGAYQKQFNFLISCKGVGLLTAMTFLLELGELHRFPDTIRFCGYVGLTPSQHSSGEYVRLGHITHEGNSHVRHALIESAWTVIRHDHFLREKYDRLRARGPNGKKAIVAVARSLAVRLRRCILTETPYVMGIG